MAQKFVYSSAQKLLINLNGVFSVHLTKNFEGAIVLQFKYLVATESVKFSSLRYASEVEAQADLDKILAELSADLIETSDVFNG